MIFNVKVSDFLLIFSIISLQNLVKQSKDKVQFSKLNEKQSYHAFFWSLFFGSFGQLAVQAAQFLAVHGRQVCVGILGSNFLGGQGM